MSMCISQPPCYLPQFVFQYICVRLYDWPQASQPRLNIRLGSVFQRVPPDFQCSLQGFFLRENVFVQRPMPGLRFTDHIPMPQRVDTSCNIQQPAAGIKAFVRLYRAFPSRIAAISCVILWMESLIRISDTVIVPFAMKSVQTRRYWQYAGSLFAPGCIRSPRPGLFAPEALPSVP